MSNIHFRKRYLQRYNEEQSILKGENYPTTYPLSPSSLNSGKSSPFEEELQNQDIGSSRTMSTLHINDANKINHNLPDKDFSPTTMSAEAWLYIANILMESIQNDYSQQQECDSKSLDSMPSPMLLDNETNDNTTPLNVNNSPHKPKVKEIIPTIKKVKRNLKTIKKLVGRKQKYSSSQYLRGGKDIERIYKVTGVDQACFEMKRKLEEVVEPENVNIVGSEPESPFTSNVTEVIPERDCTQNENDELKSRINNILENVNIAKRMEDELSNHGVKTTERILIESPQKTDDELEDVDNPSDYENEEVWWKSTEHEPNVQINASIVPEEFLDLQIIETEEYPYTSPDDDEQFVIGPNGTKVAWASWHKIDWNLSPQAIVRKVLMAVFDREILATHSLSGRPSPAFKDMNRPEKMPLDKSKVDDIIFIITSKVNFTAREVRMTITSKCADECKMTKFNRKNQLKASIDMENIRTEPY